MPNDCPRIEVSEKEDALFFFEQVRKHALKLVKQELARDKMDKDKEALNACQRSIDEWISAAQKSMEPNLTVNGMSFADGDAQTETFDVQLSKEVQKLREEADQLTAEVVKARKRLPKERANALQARFEILDRRGSKAEQQRRRIEAEADARIEKMAETGEDRPKVSLPRADQVGAILESAVDDIKNLSVALLEQSSAAQEQARFVKRLRTMSASYA